MRDVFVFAGSNGSFRSASQALPSKPSLARWTARWRFDSSSSRADCLDRIVGADSHSDSLSPAFHRSMRSIAKAATALSCLRPARGGGQRTVFANMSNSVHAPVEFSWTVFARARINTCAHAERALLGTCFIVGLAAWKTCSMLGRISAFARGMLVGAVTACAAATLRSSGLHAVCTPLEAATQRPHTRHRAFLCLCNHSSGTCPSNCPLR